MRAGRFAACLRPQAVLKPCLYAVDFFSLAVSLRITIPFRRSCERRADSQDRRSAPGVDNGS